MSNIKKSLIKKIPRETFNTKFGFIWSCVGSAVGVGTIWMFPYRLGQYGGSEFLIEYIIFTILLGVSGVIGEMAFGRAMRSGPVGAFAKATRDRFNNKKIGKFLGLIPVLGSLCIAIGYSVVIGWIIRFMLSSIGGELLKKDAQNLFLSISGDFGNIGCHLLGFALILFIMICGVSNGIEKMNKILMPLFFLLFIILVIKVATLPDADKGYNYLFRFDFKQIVQPNKTWIYALGQAFFSLSLAGSGTLIYGSYLKDDEDINYCAKNVVLFDVLAGLIAALAIIPAMFSFKLEAQAGPSLLFIAMPKVFAQIPFGTFFEIIFFIAILFAALTSIINLFEVPIEEFQNRFKVSRNFAVIIVILISAIISLYIENGAVVEKWMDIISIYVVPLGALLAGIMFFWVCDKDFVLTEVNKGSKRKKGKYFIVVSKYIFPIVTLLVLIFGVFFGLN